MDAEDVEEFVEGEGFVGCPHAGWRAAMNVSRHAFLAPKPAVGGAEIDDRLRFMAEAFLDIGLYDLEHRSVRV